MPIFFGFLVHNSLGRGNAVKDGGLGKNGRLGFLNLTIILRFVVFNGHDTSVLRCFCFVLLLYSFFFLLDTDSRVSNPASFGCMRTGLRIFVAILSSIINH